MSHNWGRFHEHGGGGGFNRGYRGYRGSGRGTKLFTWLPPHVDVGELATCVQEPNRTSRTRYYSNRAAAVEMLELTRPLTLHWSCFVDRRPHSNK